MTPVIWIFKLAVFLPMWVFPGVVDMMARSIVRRRGEYDFWYDATDDLYAQHTGKYIRVCVRGGGTGQWIEVRQSNTDYFKRGWWLLKLWWAL